MFFVFQEEMLLSAGMFLCMAISILGKISLGVLYQNMIKETENMRTTDHKILKQCKLKFSNCHKLGNGVSNVSVFVEKFLGQIKVGPFSCRTFYHLSGQAMLLSVLFAGMAVCRRLIAGALILSVLPFYIVCFLGLYLYFAVSSLVDVKGLRKVLKTNLVDYFENHIMGRSEEEPESIKGAESDSIKGIGPEKRDLNRGLSAFSPLEQKELEELLKEFLTS